MNHVPMVNHALVIDHASHQQKQSQITPIDSNHPTNTLTHHLFPLLTGLLFRISIFSCTCLAALYPSPSSQTSHRILLQRVLRHIQIHTRLERTVSQRILRLTLPPLPHLEVPHEFHLVSHPAIIIIISILIHQIVACRSQQVALLHRAIRFARWWRRRFPRFPCRFQFRLENRECRQRLRF